MNGGWLADARSRELELNKLKGRMTLRDLLFKDVGDVEDEGHFSVVSDFNVVDDHGA